ncbi:Protein of unknown function, partial [Gryllus bimaculatus]
MALTTMSRLCYSQDIRRESITLPEDVPPTEKTTESEAAPVVSEGETKPEDPPSESGIGEEISPDAEDKGSVKGGTPASSPTAKRKEPSEIEEKNADDDDAGGLDVRQDVERVAAQAQRRRRHRGRHQRRHGRAGGAGGRRRRRRGG